MSEQPRYDTEACHCGERAYVLVLDNYGRVVSGHCRRHTTITGMTESCWVLRLDAA